MRLTSQDVQTSTFSLLVAATVVLGIGAGTHAQQRGPEPTVKSGTIVEVAKQGRVQTLKYTDDAGAEQSVVLNAKVQAYIEAPGDAQFLRPGQFITTVATESNGQLFAKEVSVLLFGKSRPPVGRIQKAPRKTGQSVNSYQVSGTISAIGPDKDYPQYQRIETKEAGQRAPVMLDEGFKVTVKSMNFSLAEAGTPIELEGRELGNGRFIVTRVAAKLDEPLKAAEVFGGDGDQGAAEK